jgi:chaperonin GroES
MKLRPLHDRILVKRLDKEEKTKGGIIIPDSAKEKPQQGKVVAIGNGKRLEDGRIQPLDVKVGDKILFGKYSGTDLKLEGDEVLMLREEDVLGVLD